MNKEEFDKAKAEENKIAQNKPGRLCVEHIIEKGFNEGADWAYDLLQKENEALKAKLEVARSTLKKANDEYWNRSYEGSGKVKSMKLGDFDKMILDTLADLEAENEKD